ncbi:MAG: hypothetical protein JEZ06_09870 [Anaerolineaceae bacterium]|nr:hypothetical protein [Anaerolineaceae bacterium]MBI9044782.1 hypothetical protein [Anaerolineaceae bacterium]
MSQTEIYMDVEAVQAMADKFDDMSDVLKAVAKALETAMMILKVTAFVGLVGGAAVERFISMIKPVIEQTGEKCKETQMDIIGAIVSYRDGDSTGSQRFAG